MWTVQTFLPYPDFAKTAAVLDERRLGKQRVETLQILRAIHIPTYGWQHHPAVRMWRGYEQALVTYGVAMCREWVAREHPDTVEPQLLEFAVHLRVGHVRPSCTPGFADPRQGFCPSSAALSERGWSEREDSNRRPQRPEPRPSGSRRSWSAR